MSIVEVNGCRVEILTDGEDFLGLGRAWIGDTLVRSGRLPLRPSTQSFAGWELARLTVQEVVTEPDEIRLALRAHFLPLEIKLLRDHSLDPIHDTADWLGPRDPVTESLTLVLRPAAYQVHGYAFQGFSYHYEYAGTQVPLFYLMDKASWELDGEAAGATVFSQSSCSEPVVTLEPETFFTTEGELFFIDQAAMYNRVMTHNLPRWASHQAFDFQFRGDATLLGLFDHVDLIRSVLRREPGKAELKCFDKHIFDETLHYRTAPKAILLNRDPKTLTTQRNLWTWVQDDVHRRARAEFGLREQPPLPLCGHHYWSNRTIDTYYHDIVPAMAAVGIKGIFTENFKKSDAGGPAGEEDYRLHNGNMCTSQEYVISDRCGGMEKFKAYIARCQELGLANYLWTNTYVSLAAAINAEHRCESGTWYCAMEDTRTKYAGAYTSVSSNLNFKNPVARQYYVDAHRAIVQESGLEGYFIDSFYNLFFMPLSYHTGHPQTMWREALQVMKELQDAGAGFYIESFGPFGQPQHGHPSSYNPQQVFICYYVGLGNDYVTVPVPGVQTDQNPDHDPAFLFFLYAHKVPYAPPLFINGRRVDQVYGEEHRRVIALYHQWLPQMYTRYLQEDGLGVLWHNEAGDRALLWNFVDRQVELPGTVTDLAAGQVMTAPYQLQPSRVYGISNCPLPETVA